MKAVYTLLDIVKRVLPHVTSIPRSSEEISKASGIGRESTRGALRYCHRLLVIRSETQNGKQMWYKA